MYMRGVGMVVQTMDAAVAFVGIPCHVLLNQGLPLGTLPKLLEREEGQKTFEEHAQRILVPPQMACWIPYDLYTWPVLHHNPGLAEFMGLLAYPVYSVDLVAKLAKGVWEGVCALNDEFLASKKSSDVWKHHFETFQRFLSMPLNSSCACIIIRNVFTLHFQ